MRSPLYLLLVATALSAAPIEFSLTGTVTQVDPLLAGSFSVGQGVVGLYQFESTTPDSAGDPASGVYFNAGPLFTTTVGALTYTASVVNITINNLPLSDTYRVEGSTAVGPGVSSFVINTLVLALTDNTAATALPTDALPPASPALAGFNIRTLTLTFVDGNRVASVVAQVDTLSSSSVPEPALALPLLAALFFTQRGNRRAPKSL